MCTYVFVTLPKDIDLDAWRTHLAAHAVPIERETTWPTGAKSLYFRDPAANSIELLAGNLWPD
ncbi:MAG: hypothetical protein HS101_18600 [Planctomycetia bacterium]|nr:hypothetical protein [Planctomycetia bacterium]MCC7315261.1 hypothetical protein [Planctomycetota bacterium]